MDSEAQETEEAMPSVLDRSQHPENWWEEIEEAKRIREAAAERVVEREKLARELEKKNIRNWRTEEPHRFHRFHGEV